jgi:lincosamide nucleotidyltransferase
MNTGPNLEIVQETLEILLKVAKNSPHTIALVGAGSAGAEIARMDQYSDIDFFLIVEDGYSSGFINDNSWFGKELPIVFAFRDTDHGNKALLQNGVFLEFAIFTQAELAQNGIPGLRIIWSKPGFSLPDLSSKQPIVRELSYYVDQALSNLFVGALRLRRGERLAALAMIERYALTNLLTAYRVKNNLTVQDPFNIERRAEQALDVDLAALVQGYERLEQSLAKILAFAEENFEVNRSMAQSIRELLNS